jgi:alpha-tubulin suppressor-like RCC1 family protein
MKITYKNKRNIFLFVAITLFCLAYAIERPTIAYTIKEQISPTEKNDFKEENLLSTKQDKNLVTSQPFSGFDPTTDSDGDGIPDYLDLDDDNDGIPDCVENGFEGPVSNYFQLNEFAEESDFYEITLTSNIGSQSGQAWSKGQVDFTQSFQLRFQAYLGNNTNGADGMAMVFQNSPQGGDAVGATGDGLGARGIQNGIALELDTYANTGHPAYDPFGSHGHGQIWRTSDQVKYTDPIELGNLKDGEWHDVEITWNEATQTLSYTVDGTLAGSHTFTNIVSQVFGGDGRVYFGYTASTGLYHNLQKVRFLDPCIDLPMTLDTDGDGIPDYLDLDSDGDGCPDAIEGAGNFNINDLTTASGVLTSQGINQNFGVDVDANGIPVIVGASGQGVGNSKNSNINDCPLPNVCTSGDCNENAFLFTSDPNTLEYDNLISGFHSTIAKQQDGNYLIWGQGAKPNTLGEHLYEPTLITPENGFNYTGDILKAALGTYGTNSDGYDQYAVITTDGLYIWGGTSNRDLMVHRSVKGTTTFDKMTDVNITNADPATGLPVGVAPTEVKMLFGSYATLGIVTCTGEAYVISHKWNKNGDGSTDGASEYNKWHKVSVSEGVPLRKVVAMRGTPGAMMALTSDGKIYTWGTETYLGDGTDKANRLYASEMTLPAGVVPKMIGMTKAGATDFNERYNSYYLLSTTGEVYSLGDNSKKQLGTFDNIERTQWVNVKSTDASTNMTNIVWISPNEHDNAGHAAVTALTADGKLWGWGMNHGNMLGEGGYSAVDPRYMFGGLDENDKILAVETGGHINTIFKDCEYKLGYIGHNINGSYATYSSGTGSTSPYFQFNGAKFSDLCAIPLPPYPELIDLKACPGSTFDLMDALQNPVPTGYNLQWWTTINRTPDTEVANPEEAEPGTYYAFFISNGSDCPLIEGEEVVLSYYGPTDEEYESCVCFRDPMITGLGSETQVGISLIKGRETLQPSDNWPQSRKSGFIALESNKQGMVVTRIATTDLVNITSPQEGMMVYDTTEKCLKIYSDGQWKCFATPACP